MNKAESINRIMAGVAEYINKDRKNPVSIYYFRETEESISEYDDFYVRYFSMYPGRECVYITETIDGSTRLLYVQNVEGDSVLTAVYETMNLIAEKF